MASPPLRALGADALDAASISRNDIALSAAPVKQALVEAASQTQIRPMA